jgi:hypothetical protein
VTIPALCKAVQERNEAIRFVLYVADCRSRPSHSDYLRVIVAEGLRIKTGKVEAFHGNHSTKGDHRDGTLQQQQHGQMMCERVCEYGRTESGRSERELRKVPVNVALH